MYRHSFKFVREAFIREGYRLLSSKYINNKTVLKYICGNGHIGYIRWYSWIAGKRCPECNKVYRRNAIKLNILKKLKANKFKVLTIKHVNNNYLITAVCNNGHKFTKTWYKWKAEYCPKCRLHVIPLAAIKQAFELEGYTLLSAFYTNNRTKLKYKCPNGHIHAISWNKWLLGRRCPFCSGKAKHTLMYVSEQFSKEGYTLLEKEYLNCAQKLSYVCPNGHKHYITWRNWVGGHRCPYCYGNRLDFVDVKTEIESAGHTLLSTEYFNNKHPLTIKCKHGHIFKRTFSNFGHNKSCPFCKTKERLTAPERLLKTVLLDCCVDVVIHDRDLIAPYELDFVLPKHKLAIEYCGLYWHSNEKLNDKYYHQKKLIKCGSVGYDLLTIFEDEFEYKFDSVISHIYFLLNSQPNLDIARCNVELISKEDVVKFFDLYCLGKYELGFKRVGVFFDNSLVGCLTGDNNLVYFCNKPFNYFDFVDIYEVLNKFFGNVALYVDARLFNLDDKLYDVNKWYFGYFNGAYVRNSRRFDDVRGHIFDCGYYLIKGGIYERNNG